MKNTKHLIAGLTAAICFGFSAESTVKVMTSVMSYNIHLEHCDNQPRSWNDRKPMVAQLIRSKAPEILGLQGASLGQTDWINTALKNYEYYAPISDNLKMGTDMCPILHSTSLFEQMDQGTFLIGEAIEASAEGKEHSQFLNWVKLRHVDSEKVLFVLNTRIDSKDDKKSIAIAERLEEIVIQLVGSETFLFLGDLSSTPESETISKIKGWAKDSQSSSLVSISDTEETYFGWKKGAEGERLDYVFLSSDIPANSYEVLDVANGYEYPSDHLPVFCKLRLQ